VAFIVAINVVTRLASFAQRNYVDRQLFGIKADGVAVGYGITNWNRFVSPAVVCSGSNDAPD
jgi:hypothetical protein